MQLPKGTNGFRRTRSLHEEKDARNYQVKSVLHVRSVYQMHLSLLLRFVQGGLLYKEERKPQSFLRESHGLFFLLGANEEKPKTNEERS